VDIRELASGREGDVREKENENFVLAGSLSWRGFSDRARK
jgi:hypothetical protein